MNPNSPFKVCRLVLIVLAGVVLLPAQNTSSGAADLSGTSWQLVKFQGGDGLSLTPDQATKYTVAFDAKGGVSVRIDCNRGHGTWKSSEARQIEFGPMALTRAMCPPAPLNDRMAKDWQYVRSYTLRDGHLFLSLMADGGNYEFEPLGKEAAMSGRIRGAATYRERMALPPYASFDATLEDTSRADASAGVVGSAHLDHPGNPPFKFVIAYDPAKIDRSHTYSVRGRITVGDQLMFTTTQSYPVLTQNHGRKVSLLLQRTGGAGAGAASASGLSQLPATFSGTMPCADCPGIHYQLSLNSDHTYTSTMKYEERQAVVTESGQWELGSGGKVLELHGSRGATDKFAVRDADTLRKLGVNGNEIVSKFNYDLKREAASAAGGGMGATIEDMHWSLKRLGDKDIAANAEPQEIFLLLDSKEHRVSGSSGCNRMMGGYQLAGDQLKFTQMAGTMMACEKGMDTEREFLQALGQVNSWKITGSNLELFDSSGKALARFEAQSGQ